MAGTLPRPKRKSTKSKPEVAPEEVLYTDTDRSGDTLDLELSSLCPNPFNKREKKGVPELAATIDQVGLLQSIAHIRADVWLETYPETKDQITAPNVILFGEHRWLACQELGWETIPSVLRDDKVGDARLITLI
ncbi:chromosome partitioning protein ParB, partial [Corynebacterium pseudodiphtheriticum]|uniref:ParB N-terminal domain-containing protein n=1 Tax=Corynebacterium pseudodiphtheriticum TaxID=37637 RepID=UPI000FAEBE98